MSEVKITKNKKFTNHRPPTVKSILKTPKIFKFEDIFKDRFTSTYNYWL